MDIQDKGEKVKALRGNLKDGRTTQSDENLMPDSRDNDPASGTAFQDARGTVESLASNSNRSQRNTRKSGGYRRGAETKSLGERPTDRRSGEDNSGSFGDSDATESGTIGRIIAADDPLPVRNLQIDKQDGYFDAAVNIDNIVVDLSSKYPGLDRILSENPKISSRALGKELGISHETANQVKKEWLENHKPIKASKEGFKIPSLDLGKGSTLTKSEVSEYQESLTAAFESDFQTLDQYLWHRQMSKGIDTNEQPIWSDLDDEETEKLTKLMLRWGQRNAAVATVTRGVVESSDYIAVASIFVPRIKQTVDIMKQTHTPRVRRGARSNENSN